MEIVVDRKWYEKMKENDLLAQKSTNLDIDRARWQNQEGNRGRTPNLWNNERLGNNTPGNGKVNVGIKINGIMEVDRIKKMSKTTSDILKVIDGLEERVQMNKLK